MAWTYAGDPSANDRDEVRFLVGDTDTTDQLLTDEEIAYLVAEYSDNVVAAHYACLTIAALFSRKADFTIGKTRVSASQRAKAYQERATELRTRAGASIFVGGRTISGKETLAEDSDKVQPLFRRGQFTQPGSESDDSGLFYDPDA